MPAKRKSKMSRRGEIDVPVLTGFVPTEPILAGNRAGQDSVRKREPRKRLAAADRCREEVCFSNDQLFLDNLADNKLHKRHIRFPSESDTIQELTTNITTSERNLLEDIFVLDTVSSMKSEANEQFHDPVNSVAQSSCYTTNTENDCDIQSLVSLNSVLTPSQMETDRPPLRTRPKIVCFNCEGDHVISKCPRPRDNAKITRNRIKMMNMSRANGMAAESSRYHGGNKEEGAKKYRPGVISRELMDALNMRPNELPEWIYRMRQLGFIAGYPPGYLKQAISRPVSTSRPLHFHIDDSHGSEDRDRHSKSPSPVFSELESRKMIYYFGFNKEPRPGTFDREKGRFSIPPFETFVSLHQEKLTKEYNMEKAVSQHKMHIRQSVQGEHSPAKKKRSLADSRSLHKTDQSAHEEDNDVLLPPPPRPPSDYDDMPVEELERLQKEISNALFAATSHSAVVDEDTRDSSSKEKRMARTSSSRSLHMTEGTAMCQFAVTRSLNKPSLEQFSKGIVPFEAREEPNSYQKGFFKRFISIFRSKDKINNNSAAVDRPVKKAVKNKDKKHKTRKSNKGRNANNSAKN